MTPEISMAPSTSGAGIGRVRPTSSPEHGADHGPREPSRRHVEDVEDEAPEGGREELRERGHEDVSG